jgi:hypothetical protein
VHANVAALIAALPAPDTTPAAVTTAYAADEIALAVLLGAPAETTGQLAACVNETPGPDPSITWHGVNIYPAGDTFGLRPALHGPGCEEPEHIGYCTGHPSCNDIGDEAPWAEECPRGHGWQHVTGTGGGGGFAGGAVYWTDLECGCTVMDESGDVAAAR